MFDITDFTTGSVCDFRDFALKGEMQNIYLEFHESKKRIAGNDWWFGLVKEPSENGTTVVPLFSFFHSIPYPYVSVRVLFEPVNHLGKSNKEFKYTDTFYHKTDGYIWGKKMYLSEVLDTKNGWLSEDGTFTWNAGICVEGLMTPKDIWEFNFYPFPFKCPSGRAVLLFNEDGEFYFVSHIMMFKIHCSKLSEILTEKNHILGCPCWHRARVCLNILHGVQWKFKTNDQLFEVLEIAKLYGFQNVIRYCERQLIEDPTSMRDLEERILLAIQADFNRYLSILLKGLKQENELLKILKKTDIGMMSGESMKICVKKLFYGKNKYF